jgi:DNA-binding NtrC family response regulator
MENILLVEDDVALRVQIRFALEESFNIFEAGNVEGAKVIFNKDSIDVVILDLGLPPSVDTYDEGIKLLHYVLNSSSAKIIILTGQKTESAALEAIKSGAFDYIMKPVEMDKILFSVSRAILFRDVEKKIEEQGIKKISFSVEMGGGLQLAREEAEKNIIMKVLRDTNFNIYRSAKILGVKRESLYYFIKKFGWKREDDND